MLQKANMFYLKSLNDGEKPFVNKGSLPDMKGRYRDCAVINSLHGLIELSPAMKPFDTVRSVFF